MCACDVSPDDIALDDIPLCRATGNPHTGGAIPGDQIAGRRAGSSCQAADDVIRSAIGVHADIWIRQNYCSCNVGANKVALDRVVIPTEQINAATVRGYNVTGINGCAADEAIRGVDKNASVRVSQRHFPRSGCARLALCRQRCC